MKCENCGANVPDDVASCPDCGAPAAPAPSAPASGSGSSRRRGLIVGIVALVALAVIVAGGALIFRQFGASNSPDGAVLRMMNAFAAYDAQGILDNATHASLTATDQATFAQQAATSKTDNKGLPAVKNISITKVTLASPDATSATVQLTADWLSDAGSKKYTQRAETLTVVKQDGKWLVKLFQ